MSHSPAHQTASPADFQARMLQLRKDAEGVRRSRQSRCRNQLRWLTAGHIVGIASLWYAIWNVSEQWWLGSVLTFLPRTPWLAPGMLLILVGMWQRSGTVLVNLVLSLFVLWSIVGFNVPWQTLVSNTENSNLSNDRSARTVRIVSANTQQFEPNFTLLLREIRSAKPDVIALQEASRPPKSLSDQYPDWHSVRVRGLWVGSKWPIKLIGQCHSDVYDRVTAIMVEVEAPFGKFLVTDLHLMTARRSLIYLQPKSVITGTGQETVNVALVERSEEARQTREFVTEFGGDQPLIICGDFNMPTSSSIYRNCFGDFANSFEQTSWGCGYTAPCRAIRYWPTNVPWQRIDHILANHNWRIIDSQVGRRDGSDHRLMAATLRLKGDGPSPDDSTNAPSNDPDNVEQLRAGR
jgi:endonuclease/exonuclease/phosphatase family metal-dependent hydrolase